MRGYAEKLYLRICSVPHPPSPGSSILAVHFYQLRPILDFKKVSFAEKRPQIGPFFNCPLTNYNKLFLIGPQN